VSSRENLNFYPSLDYESVLAHNYKVVGNYDAYLLCKLENFWHAQF
jgi:hypothetical protein